MLLITKNKNVIKKKEKFFRRIEKEITQIIFSFIYHKKIIIVNYIVNKLYKNYTFLFDKTNKTKMPNTKILLIFLLNSRSTNHSSINSQNPKFLSKPYLFFLKKFHKKSQKKFSTIQFREKGKFSFRTSFLHPMFFLNNTFSSFPHFPKI